MTNRTRIAAALLAVGLGMSGCGAEASPSFTGPSHSATESVGGQSSPSPTSEPARELRWTAESFPGHIHALTEDQGRLVAVGRDAEGLASWTSTDGDNWERHDVPNPTFIEAMLDDFGPQLYAGTRMGSLTRLGDTLFSFGTFYGPNDFYRPVAWRSPDGATWEFVESKNEFYDYGATTDALTFGDTLVAARTVGLGAPTYSLWTWTAQTSWTESSVKSTTEGIVALITVLDVSVGDGAILAVGDVARPTNGPQEEWPTDPVGWRSDDGARWDEVAPPDDMELAYMVAAAPGEGFSVLGRGTVGTTSVWHTTDGSRWTGTDLDVCRTVEACEPYGLTRAGDWLVATIRVKQRGAIWLSLDGMNWIRQQMPGMPFPDGPIAELGGDLFVFSRGESAEDGETILLRGQAPV